MSAKSRNKRYVLARDFLSHWVRFIDRLKHYKTIESIAAEEKNVLYTYTFRYCLAGALYLESKGNIVFYAIHARRKRSFSGQE